ncbi:hypothetical protein F4781DRAFT_72318 [Annulohypoxylon bovei var. microspora]|nr:hypothetical protein F4781DRAFT_72318 [Annulohypoxylon bovei var. microspora]
MESVAAIALVCNVFDLTERAIKCAKKARDVYNSVAGLPKEHERLLAFTNELDAILEDVRRGHDVLKKAGIEDTHIQTVASECQGFSSDIETLLDRCRTKRPASMKSAFSVVIRTHRNKDDLKVLQDNLEKRQQTLHLALAASARIQISKVGKALDEEHVRNYSLKQQLNAVQQNLNILSDVPNKLQQALSLCRQAQTARDLHHVFQMLGDGNNSMRPNPRYDEVHAAHEETFEWIFHDPEKVFKVEPDLKLSFVDWLRDGKDIFHILGKPGSGKSTLMKFIWNHKDTEKNLMQWAGQSQLLRMKYFFWKSGSGQNRLQGLRRFLLKSALEHAPELFGLLLPGPDGRNTGLHTYLDDDKISRACDMLMGDPRILERHKIFILIDGLDEFEEEGNAQDYNDLVRTIQDWTSQSNEKVKICVSSREYEVFRSITRNQKFRLQNLTREDMQTFVTGRLKDHPRFSDLKYTCKQNTKNLCRRYGSLHICSINCLIRHIVKSAHGVFLWARLMVSEIRRKYLGYYRLDELWEHVRTAPKELNPYLEQMLDSMSPQYQREAYILLAIVYKFETLAIFKPVIVPIYGASYLWDLLLREHVKPSGHPGDCVNWNNFTEEEVDARFNGLLELKCHDEFPELHSLLFTHRSIIGVLDKHLDTKLHKYGITETDLGKHTCQLMLGYLTSYLRVKNEKNLYYDSIRRLFDTVFLVLDETNLLEKRCIMEQLD